MALVSPIGRPGGYEVQTRRLELSSGVTLAADVYGTEDRPPVLLLHGGGQTRHAWGGTAAALEAAGFLAVAVDLRGHGDSEWSDAAAYDVADMASDVVALRRHLPRPPALVGASLGGLAILDAMRDQPSLGRAVVLVDVTPRLQATGVRRILDFMSARPEGFASLEEAADAVSAYLPQRKRPTDLSGLARSLRQGPDGRLRWHWDPRLLATWDRERSIEEKLANVSQRLDAAASLQVPTLLVRGRMSDVVGLDNVAEFRARVPHAEFVDLEGAAHMVAGDRNDRFCSVITEFLRRIDG